MGETAKPNMNIRIMVVPEGSPAIEGEVWRYQTEAGETLVYQLFESGVTSVEPSA